MQIQLSSFIGNKLNSFAYLVVSSVQSMQLAAPKTGSVLGILPGLALCNNINIIFRLK